MALSMDSTFAAHEGRVQVLQHEVGLHGEGKVHGSAKRGNQIVDPPYS
jgi:hypothetical protein